MYVYVLGGSPVRDASCHSMSQYVLDFHCMLSMPVYLAQLCSACPDLKLCPCACQPARAHLTTWICFILKEAIMHRKLPWSGDIYISLCTCGHVYVNILHLHGPANKNDPPPFFFFAAFALLCALAAGDLFIPLAQMSVQEVSLLDVHGGNHM